MNASMVWFVYAREGNESRDVVYYFYKSCG